MKVAYYGEQAPRSIRPLVLVIVGAWVVIAMGIIIFSGVV